MQLREKKKLTQYQQGEVMQGLFPVTILPGMAGKRVAQNNKKFRGYAE